MAFIKVSERRQERATFLLSRLKSLMLDVSRVELQVGKVLLEIYAGEYYKIWGFDNFNQWAYSEPVGLRFSKVRYLLKIARLAQICRIPDDTMEKLSLSSLRSATSLLGKKPPEDIVALLTNPKMSNAQMKNEVNKNLDRELTGHYAYVVRGEEALKTVDRAIRRAKVNRVISASEAFVEICRDYLKFAG